MPLHPPEKKQKLLEVDGFGFGISFDALGVDELANILEFLQIDVIVRSRRVSTKWKEAARKTSPPSKFYVDSLTKYNAVRVVAMALPNLQHIELGRLGRGHKYNDGEDPLLVVARNNADCIAHDVEIISNFSKLRILDFCTWNPGLNGKYPFLFSSFPLLQKLKLHSGSCNFLKWDLDMLAGFPLLKELGCWSCACLTGNTSSLRVLKGTLEKAEILDCYGVYGNLMDLADFPHLKKLDLRNTSVTGDVRDIKENDFSALEPFLHLPTGVCGGAGYEFQRISDVPAAMHAMSVLQKRTGLLYLWVTFRLSEDSPDWYPRVEMKPPPPFYVRFIQAPERLGWRWVALDHRGELLSSCDVNWLDPLPDGDSGKYQKENILPLYRGYHQPPTEAEYTRLCEECNYNYEPPDPDDDDYYY
jgi:hypothetical protein